MTHVVGGGRSPVEVGLGMHELGEGEGCRTGCLDKLPAEQDLRLHVLVSDGGFVEVLQEQVVARAVLDLGRWRREFGRCLWDLAVESERCGGGEMGRRVHSEAG